MSGILGMWNLNGRPAEKAVLAGLSETLAHRGPDAEGLWVQGSVGLASRLFRVTPESSTETQPLVQASGAVVVFDGRLDNREELLKDLKSSCDISAASPDPALVLAAYEAFGDQFPERLTGDFALGLFDPKRHRLLVARDAIGVRPLYYYRSQDLFLFASEIKAILAHPQVAAQPQDDCLAGFLLDGTLDSQGMTFFKDIFGLLPSHLAVLTPDEFRTRRYWDFDLARQTRFKSFPDYAEAFRHHLEQAVGRRLRSAYPVAVSVSGGLDSSSILCLAETLRQRGRTHYPPLLGISYTSADGTPSDEKAFLLEIERAYGIAIERIPTRLGSLQGCRDAVWSVESPFMDNQWNTTHRLLQTARSRGARVLLTGHWGDQILFTPDYLNDLFDHLKWGQVWTHLEEIGRWCTDVDPWQLRRGFVHDLVRRHVPEALIPWLRRLRAHLTRSTPSHLWYTEGMRKRAWRFANSQPHADGRFPTAYARALYKEARSKYYGLCMEWNNKVASRNGLEMAFPFFDRDLISFLMSIPGDMQAWKGVPKAILREALRGVLPEAIRERRWKADFSDLVNAGRERDYPQLVQCLQAEEMAVKFGYVKGTVLRKDFARIKERIRGPNCAVSWGLSDLLGLELWLQVFFGKNNNIHTGLRTRPCGLPTT
ncbi:MAG: asparagine synthetase B [Nitrospirae bacterium]|nr:MAG: asparagine synthetase B [Nitrospirota bacterium]